MIEDEILWCHFHYSWWNSHIQFKYCQLTNDRITVLRIYHVGIKKWNKKKKEIILYYPLHTTNNTTKSCEILRPFVLVLSF